MAKKRAGSTTSPKPSVKRIKAAELKNLLQKKSDLVESIRKYVRGQKKLWQKIPYLALRANGVTGFSDQYSRAYLYGYWAFEANVLNRRYRVYVDLATGELIQPWHPEKAPEDNNVLVLISNPEDLNATGIIKELLLQAKKPSAYNPAESRANEQYRENVKKKLNLRPIYIRTRHYPNEFSLD